MENVQLTDHGSFEPNYALSWEDNGVRFHIWENDPCIVYKNPPLTVKYSDAGYFHTRKLDATSQANRSMILKAREIATNENLRERTIEAKAQKKQDEGNARLASIALRFKREAAEELYAALSDVEWSDCGHCPQCAGIREVGHQPECILGNALAKAKGA